MQAYFRKHSVLKPKGAWGFKSYGEKEEWPNRVDPALLKTGEKKLPC